MAKNSKMKCCVLFVESFFFSNFGAIREVKMILEASMKDGVQKPLFIDSPKQPHSLIFRCSTDTSLQHTTAQIHYLNVKARPKTQNQRTKNFQLVAFTVEGNRCSFRKQAAEEYSSLHNQYIFKAAAIQDDAACSETIPLKYKYNR